MRNLQTKLIILLAIISISVFATNVKADEAFPEAKNGKITLTEDITISKQQDLSGNITIDLNGHKIIKPEGNYYAIHNTGTLTIIDSGSTKGEIICSFVSTLEGTITCIDNEGTLSINEVKVSSDGIGIKTEVTGNTTIKNSTILGLVKASGKTNGAILNAGVTKVDNTIVDGKSVGIYVTGVAEHPTKTEIINSNITGTSGSIVEGNGDTEVVNEITVTNGTFRGYFSKKSINTTFKVSGDIKINNNPSAAQDGTIGLAQYAEKGTKITMMNTGKIAGFTLPEGVTLVVPSDIEIKLNNALATINGTVEGKIISAATYEAGHMYGAKLVTIFNNIPKKTTEPVKIKLLADSSDTVTNSALMNLNVELDLNGYDVSKNLYVWEDSKLSIIDNSKNKEGTFTGYINLEDGGNVTLPKYMELKDENNIVTYKLNKVEHTFNQYSIVIKEADYSEYDELSDIADKLEEKKYTTDSFLELRKTLNSAALFIGNRTLSGSLQEKIDEHCDNIREKLSALIETPKSIDKDSKEVSLGVVIDNETSTMLVDSRSKTLQNKIDEEIDNGKIISTEIVSDILDMSELSDSDKKDIEKINNVLGSNINVGYFLDLSVIIKADGDVIGEVSETAKPIAFKIVIPEELIKDNRQFYIYRNHNGKVEKLNTKINGNILSFSSNEFSVYALAYEDITNSTKLSNPKTGDNIISYISLLGVSVIGLLGLTYIQKRN